jgi:flagellin-like hook-associated protein FlgL
MSGDITKTYENVEVLPIKEHFIALRNTDLQNVRDTLTALELRLQQRFDAQEKSIATAMIAAEKAVNAALVAAEKAVDKAEQAQALRNIVANEFRATIADNTAIMWPIKEGQSAISNLESKIEASLTSSQRELTAIIDGLNSRISVLELYRSRIDGQGFGISQVWGIIIAAIGILFGIIGIGIALIK